MQLDKDKAISAQPPNFQSPNPNQANAAQSSPSPSSTSSSAHDTPSSSENPAPSSTKPSSYPSSSSSSSSSPSSSPKQRTLHITSYGHTIGPLAPRPTLKFDVRALPNPPKHVRSSQLGIYKPLQEWFFAREEVQTRFLTISSKIEDALQIAEANDQNDVFIGVCCQLGKHRSVAMVEALGRRAWLAGWSVEVGHRDMLRRRGQSSKDGTRTKERKVKEGYRQQPE
ncbi:hypothetical protein CC1G_08958 [Coprinopsis cinerea okayama7|uniref:RapZ C-terminal domain-containing protein n=1 Tax=Coprinopsis cinerea (strain Okayama-7 / 130 / ATCC MYA-4618 / FGSC 9003) TaxID=240176 RepID=A8P4R4_COPC7|nr:hypothetical protein CC1G_08958 [Coprinopsis cinerea okayama7\|eukprot:XP_001838794.2 hypothetical protein CC1G_08958 [Coprinopsis cinerea okayama7\